MPPISTLHCWNSRLPELSGIQQFLLRLCAVFTFIAAGSGTAHAVVYDATSNGHGASINLSLAGLNLVNTGDLAKSSGTAPPAYSAAGTAIPLNVTAGLLGLNLVSATGSMSSTAVSNVNGSTGNRTTTASGTVQSVSVSVADPPFLPALIAISADVLASQCSSSGDAGSNVVTGSSTITNLVVRISGVTINLATLGVAVNPAPNTGVDLSLAGLAGATLYLNEQTPVTGSNGTEIEVTALRLKLTAVSAGAYGLVSGEIKLGHSYARQSSVANVLTVQKTVDRTQASIKLREIFNFRLQYTCSSLLAATNGTLTDVLDPALEIVALQGSAHTSGSSYNSASRTVTFQFSSPLAAGATGEVVIQARFVQTAAGGTVASNYATAAATNSSAVNSNTVTILGYDPFPPPGSISGNKYAPASVLQSAPAMDYWIGHGNAAAAGTNLSNYVVEDVLPANLTAQMISTDSYSGASSLPVTVRYKTNLNGSWRQWGSGALYNAAQASTVIPVANLGLPAAEKVTALRFEYGTLIGGSHSRNAQTSPLGIRVVVPQSPMIASGTTVQNCADITADGISARSCADTLIRPAQGNPVMRQALTTPGIQFQPGELAGIELAFGIDADSNQPMTDPVIGVLIPAEFEYAGPWSVSGTAWQNAGSPTPYFEKLDNFGNTGLSLLRWSWTAARGNSFTMPVIQAKSETLIHYTLRVKTGTAAGSYLQTMWGNWLQPSDAGLALTYAGDDKGYVSGNLGSGAPSGTDPMQTWNLVTFDDFSTSSAVLGRAFIGRSLVSPHAASFGGGLTGTGSSDTVLAVGRNLVAGDPLALAAGSLRIKGLSNSRLVNFAGGGSLIADSSIDVSPLRTTLQNRSAALRSLAANGIPVPPGSGNSFILRAPAGAGGQTVVFNVAASALFSNAQVQQIELEAGGAAAIVVNVSGSSVNWTSGTMVGTLTDNNWKSKVLWNFHEAAAINLGAHSFSGALLAPYAAVTGSGNIEGAVAAASVSLSGSVNLPVYMATPFAGLPAGSPASAPAVPVQAARSELYIQTAASSLASLEATMWFRGELNSEWLQFPSTGLSTPGGKADYRLQIENTGNVSMRNLVIVDILPKAGDTNVLNTASRGSEWTPILAGTVTAPTGVTVYYSSSSNPCRPELVPAGPAGCEDAHWTSNPPADITTVRSLKFDFGPIQIVPEEEAVISWPMRAPWDGPTAGQVAWNSLGFVSTRADNDAVQPAYEPMKTGFMLQAPAPPFYGDRVWVDLDKDGLLDSGEPGLNGIRVDLYKDNGDNIANVLQDTFVTFTVTSADSGGDGSWLFGNMGTGSFFAVVRAPEIFGISPKDQGGDDSLDSDGNSVVIHGSRAAVMPVTELDAGEDDRTWDQGLIDRSGIPAVWAVAQLSGGKVLLGGRFATAHGIARSNIARVNADGSVDAAFNPGTGFNGPVRSIESLGAGALVTGGEFTSYNGQAANGLAIIDANGQFLSGAHMPDRAQVNWVGSSGTSIYLAGEFTRVGGVTCGNLARLNSSRQFDASYLCRIGANGRINHGCVDAAGKLVLCGGFSMFEGTQRGGVVRLLASGAIDPQFNTGTGANAEVFSITPIEDGRMVLTGAFTAFNGVPCNGTIRLKANGSVDADFARSALAVDSIHTSN